MNPWVILAAVLAFAAGAVLGEWDGAKRAGLRCTAQAEAKRAEQLGDWVTRTLEAEGRAEAIDRAAAGRDREMNAKLKETEHALDRATRGRPCLGGAALRVLDQSAGLRPPARTAHPGPLPGGSAAPAADPENAEATDTDVAKWIATAGVLYEACRERIRDIRCYDWGECD